MSKGKKGNKATPEAVSWDEGLLNATVEEVRLSMTLLQQQQQSSFVRTILG